MLAVTTECAFTGDTCVTQAMEHGHTVEFQWRNTADYSPEYVFADQFYRSRLSFYRTIERMVLWALCFWKPYNYCSYHEFLWCRTWESHPWNTMPLYTTLQKTKKFQTKTPWIKISISVRLMYSFTAVSLTMFLVTSSKFPCMSLKDVTKSTYAESI